MDIVLNTLGFWDRSRKQTASEGRQHNIATFIKQWVESPYRAGRLVAVLEQDSVRKALRERGYDITPVVVDEPHVVIRRELQTLINEPAFAAFKPSSHRKTDPTTVAECVCSGDHESGSRYLDSAVGIASVGSHSKFLP